jgi:hypothetical protein
MNIVHWCLLGGLAGFLLEWWDQDRLSVLSIILIIISGPFSLLFVILFILDDIKI